MTTFHRLSGLDLALLFRSMRLLVFGLFAFAPALWGADTATLPPGRYTLDRASLHAFEDALAKAANQIPAMQRQLALRRLRERLTPPSEIELALSGAGWALRLGENRFPPLQPGTQPVPWTSSDGQEAQVSVRWRDRTLEQSIASGDRARRNSFYYDVSEKLLRFEVEFHGSQLRRPVRFTLRYLPAP